MKHSLTKAAEEKTQANTSVSYFEMQCTTEEQMLPELLRKFMNGHTIALCSQPQKLDLLYISMIELQQCLHWRLISK